MLVLELHNADYDVDLKYALYYHICLSPFSIHDVEDILPNCNSVQCMCQLELDKCCG
jgi:hypothetical protein